MTLIRSLSACLISSLLAGAAHAAPAYARFPAIRGDTIVFTSEGDLWKVNAAGGQAQRLTTHPATEMNAALSADGKWVAFSASYEGPVEAYVMPVAGGVPRRLSYENGSVTVLGWTAQGKVLVSHQKSTGPALHRIVAAIDPASLARTVYPVADANEAVLDDQGKTLYFTRYGSHINGDNAKRYRGGAMAQLWRYTLGSKDEAVQLLAREAVNARRPMVWKDRVYYLNDANGSFNLWSMKPDGSDARAITSHTDWDVRNPALGDGRIVYQLGADLHVLDIASGAERKLAIDLVSDFDQMRMATIRTPTEQLTNVQLANKEERVVTTARGHVTVAGTGVQRRIDLAIPSGSRARNAVFSHDDKALYAIVDSTGENEIWKFPIGVNSDGKPEVLTKNGNTQRWNIYPSPDGKWIAHNDKRGRLLLLDLATRAETVIDSAGKLGVTRHSSVTWSPDSKTIAIVRPDSNYQRDQIGLISVADKKLEFVTGDRYESFSPAFSADGKWMYFLSSRTFTLGNRSPWGDRNLGPVFDKRTGVYALALQPGNRFPFKPDDELSSRVDKAETDVRKEELKDEKKEPNNKEAATKVAAAAVADARAAGTRPAGTPAIVYAGLAQRLYQVPLAAGNYQGLYTDDKRLYFLEDTSAEGSEGRANLKTLAIAKTAPQPEVFVAGIREYELSADRKRVFYRTFKEAGAGEFMIVDAGAKLPSDVSRARIAIEEWTFTANPRDEWRQMFNDAWRMHRDFLYDENMRGVDWKNMRDKYAGLVERVSDRSELNDVLSLMISEVGSMHSQVRPGDVRRAAPSGQAAALGAVLSRVDGGMRIDHIYRSEPDQPGERSPLAQPDLDIRVGDVITSVNGASVAEARDISDLLLNQAGKQVVLRVKRGAAAPRAFVVQPVSTARHDAMRYRDWEQERSERVTAASKGRIGYLHLQAMGGRDMASFARDFYSNVEREGLIIDVRRNRGGNIDSWIIEKLLRKAWAFWTSNNQVSTNMQQTFRGHLVVLVDEMTYSDGETFAAGVKALKLAPLVGKRTSGAGVWLSDSNPLSDNGMIRVAETSQFGLDGNWLIEGVGVAPDVEVDNLPVATFAGRDQQLEVALEMLEKRLKEQPIQTLKAQPVPGLR